jgi:hypothetical protein
MRHKRVATAVVTVAVVALIGAAVAFAATGTSTSRYGYGPGMMGGRYGYQPATTTSVRTLAAARTQAQKFADRLGLTVDEVLQFKDNFYAKLVDSQGNGATEVLVDPQTGAVSIEYGPAMMWNTKYGMGRAAVDMMGSYGRSMMRGYGGAMTGEYAPNPTTGNSSGATTSGGYGGMTGSNSNGDGGGTGSGATPTAATVTIADARSLAQQWLDRNESGVKVETRGDAFPGYYTFETLRGGKITGMMSVNATTGAVWPHWWHGAFIAKSKA